MFWCLVLAGLINQKTQKNEKNKSDNPNLATPYVARSNDKNFIVASLKVKHKRSVEFVA